MSADSVLSITINKIYVMGTYLIIAYLSHSILLSADNMSAFLCDIFCRDICHYLNLTFIDISPRTSPLLYVFSKLAVLEVCPVN